MSDTDRTTKRNALALWVPVGAVGGAVAFAAVAGSVWAGDRAALEAAGKTNTAQDQTLNEHRAKLDDLNRQAAVRDAQDKNTQEKLDDIRRQIDRIADRVGAKP